MSQFKKLRGMRYPDEYVIRMFYKERLDELGAGGKVLEMGCGSANNLLHFASYGWHVTGVDISEASLDDAKNNLDVFGFNGELIHHDLNFGSPKFDGLFNLLLLPSTLYYLSRGTAEALLLEIKEVLAPNALIYLRMRLPDDHRFERGVSEGRNSYRLTCDYTGELGLLNVFWEEYELVALLLRIFGIAPDSITKLRFSFENYQNQRLVRNSDIVLWGRLP